MKEVPRSDDMTESLPDSQAASDAATTGRAARCGQDNMLPLKALERIDKVCLAFEDAWVRGERPHVEQYCGDTPEPERSALLRQLLLLELDYRIRSGDTVNPGEYHTRFPDNQGLIDEVFQCCVSSGAALSPAAKVRCFGNYELLAEIDRGGMGVVYKARQLSPRRLVAIKLILSGQLASPAEVERFHREAEAAASLQHPNIVTIHEVGEHDGQHYFSMDYVEGKSLLDMVREGPLPAQRAAQYLRTIAEAIHYAHQQGTLHRDLKPANVLIDQADRPRITDFGLAKRIEAGSELTGSGQVVGTPSYMPPEQASGHQGEVGPASDVYALGATLYELVAGRPPFRGETPTDTLLQVLGTEPVAPKLLNPKVPRDLETICLKCLQKERSKRYPTADQLAEDLGRFLREEPILARPIGRVQRLWRWCRRKPLVAGLSAAVIVTLLAGTAVSSYFAVHANARAREATERLWGAYLAQAQAGRRSGIPGQRLESLKALAAAAAIRPSSELRDEAIASMALLDIGLQRRWNVNVDDVFSMGFDRQVQRYARDDNQGNLTIRRVANDAELLSLPSPGRREKAPLFSPDGRLLAQDYVCDGKAQCHVWDLDRREVIFNAPVIIPGPPAGREGLAVEFAPDSRSIAICGPDGLIHVYDLATGNETRTLLTSPSATRVLFLDPDGRQLAAYRWMGTIVQVFDLDSGSVVHRFSHPGNLNTAAASPRQSLLAVGCVNDIHVWNVQTGREQAVLRGHQGLVVEMAFNHAGDVLASSAWDSTLRFWDPLSGDELLRTSDAMALQFSPDDRRLAGFDPPSASLWEVADLDCRTLSYESTCTVWSVDFSPDGRLLAFATERGVRLLDLATGRQVASLPTASTRSALFCARGGGLGLITGSVSGIRFWPITTGTQPGRLQMGPPELLIGPVATTSPRVSVDADGQRLAAITGHGEITVLNLKIPTEPLRLSGHPRANSVAISPDGRWVATGTHNTRGGGVKVWDVGTGKVVQFLLPDNVTTYLAFSPNGQWLLTSDKAECRFWAVDSWTSGRRVARERPSTGGSIAFSQDGRMLATVHRPDTVQMIEVSTGNRLATLQSPARAVLGWQCFSPDGSLLAVAGGPGRLQLWDLRHIRQRLAEMGLDWGLPPFPPATITGSSEPLSVEVVLPKQGSPEPPASASGPPRPNIENSPSSQEEAGPAKGRSNAPALLAPRNGAILKNGTLERDQDMVWEFTWSAVPGASRYHLHVIGPRATRPIIDNAQLTVPSFRHQSRGFIAPHNLQGWRWKVRALLRDAWNDWSEERTFNVAYPGEPPAFGIPRLSAEPPP